MQQRMPSFGIVAFCFGFCRLLLFHNLRTLMVSATQCTLPAALFRPEQCYKSDIKQSAAECLLLMPERQHLLHSICTLQQCTAVWTAAGWTASGEAIHCEKRNVTEQA